MKIIVRLMLISSLIIIILGVIIGFIFLQSNQFGKLPLGNRLEIIKKSPNYKNGAFQNRNLTPDLTEGVSYWDVTKDFIIGNHPRKKPTDTIPSIKTNLAEIPIEENVLIWFGHSSYYMQLDGKRFLVDPVLSGAASPISFTTKSFLGTDIYTAKDFPYIDYLFISHDHWDHLDYKTMIDLKSKIGKIICGLGTGAHFEHWGFDSTKIIEKDWDESFTLEPNFNVHTVSARHFSGRGLKRNQSLWISFVLKTPSCKIFIGGDSGYDTHFEETGKKFGPFDLAILENGQYDKSWKYIHMMPNEVVKAAKELKSNRLLPVHSSKFQLGNHSWDEPLKKISELCKNESNFLITPIIGEVVYISDTNQVFTEWWKELY